MSNLKKVLLFLSAVLLLFSTYLTFGAGEVTERMTWGVSFSRSYAESLGIPWRQAYLAILDDLEATHLRVGSYWSDTEHERGKYDFDDLDFMVAEADRRGRKVVITLGLRQPRWPECHLPDWARGLSYDVLEPLLLRQMDAVVTRYKDSGAVAGWQVENEYFLKSFGICPEPVERYLEQEISQVKTLDPSRPVIVTDSGELSTWLKTRQYGDVFGTTVYRKVPGFFWGVGEWPYPPVSYARRAQLMSVLFGSKRILISELQMEPWAIHGLGTDTLEQYYLTFSPEQFEKNLQFARRTGIDEVYLWGAEWWYYMKTVRGVPDFWEKAYKLWH